MSDHETPFILGVTEKGENLEDWGKDSMIETSNIPLTSDQLLSPATFPGQIGCHPLPRGEKPKPCLFITDGQRCEGGESASKQLPLGASYSWIPWKGNSPP